MISIAKILSTIVSIRKSSHERCLRNASSNGQIHAEETTRTSKNISQILQRYGKQVR